MFRPQPISSTDARKYFTKIINKVSFSSKSFVIESYRQPLVRIVNEHYIKALEEVVGKKTVNQVMQIAGNDQLFEAEKIEEIKKVFQRRLSSSPRPEQSRGAGQPTSRQGPPQQPRPQPQREQDKNVVARPASPPVSKPPQTKPQPKPQPPAQKPSPQPKPTTPVGNVSRSETGRQKHEAGNTETQKSVATRHASPATPKPQKPHDPQTRKNNKILLLSNGKNYQ